MMYSVVQAGAPAVFSEYRPAGCRSVKLAFEESARLETRGSRVFSAMPLIDLWKANPSAIADLSVEQIVATAVDGKALDKSGCSTELRQYFGRIASALAPCGGLPSSARMGD